ncbi:hypothetical protein HFN89_05170 [Rhizobium laguerreae]|nr:hypothetical protein [Rhizobium laguerreae]
MGSGWHLLPEEGDVRVTTRAGEAAIRRDSLRSAVRGLYSSIVEPGVIKAACGTSLDEAERSVRAGGQVVLTKDRLDALASIWSYLSPGRTTRDDMVEAGKTLRGLHNHPVRDSLLANAAWEAHGCLMACLGGGLPTRYFFFVLEAEISALPISLTSEEAIYLRDDCLDLPDYGRVIEDVIRVK